MAFSWFRRRRLSLDAPRLRPRREKKWDIDPDLAEIAPELREFLGQAACVQLGSFERLSELVGEVLAPLMVPLMAAMPHFGAHPLPYGDAINHDGPIQRHVTNMVTAVNFDYRGFDTLGEEFMLLAAVTGTVVLLRGSRRR